MPGRKHSRRRRNKRRNRRNNVQNTPGSSTIDNTSAAGHSCLSYAELMSPDNATANSEAVAKLRAEIINLKDHLMSAHVELAELTFENFEFRKSVDKYQEKMKVLNLIAFGRESKSSESVQKKGIPPEKKTPPTSKCPCGHQDYEDQTDYDDDSDTT